MQTLRRPPLTATRDEKREFWAAVVKALMTEGVDHGEDFVIGNVEAPRNTVGPNNGTSTSKSAAQVNFPRNGTQKHKILALLKRKEGYGATREEIGLALGLSGDTVRPRVAELLEGRWVEAAKPLTTRKTQAGNDAEVLVLTGRGLSSLDRSLRTR